MDSFHLEKQKHLKFGSVNVLDNGPLRATLGATVMLGQSQMEVEVSFVDRIGVAWKLTCRSRSMLCLVRCLVVLSDIPLTTSFVQGRRAQLDPIQRCRVRPGQFSRHAQLTAVIGARSISSSNVRFAQRTRQAGADAQSSCRWTSTRTMRRTRLSSAPYRGRRTGTRAGMPQSACLPQTRQRCSD